MLTLLTTPATRLVPVPPTCKACTGRGHFISRTIFGRRNQHPCNMCGGTGMIGRKVLLREPRR